MRIDEATWHSDSLERSFRLEDLPALTPADLDRLRLEAGAVADGPWTSDRPKARLFFRACCSEYNARKRRLEERRLEAIEHSKAERLEFSRRYGRLWREALHRELCRIFKPEDVDTLFDLARKRAIEEGRA